MKRKLYSIFLSLLVFVCGFAQMNCGVDRSQTVILGCKNFTEQIILGEIIAQTIETNSDLKVIRKWNLGGTMVCHQALVSGEIDIYPEYTGTAYINVLGQEEILDADLTYQKVKQEYLTRFNCEWMPPFGMNNTYTITVRKDDAESLNLETISDLKERAADMAAGFTAEFMERPDGFPQLRKKYGLEFSKVVDLEPGLMYQAIANHEVDVICGFSTDGRIPAYDLVALEDDLKFFPPYYAAPVVRSSLLEAHPELKEMFTKLEDSVTNEKMQELNLLVDEQKQSPKTVAKNFLSSL
jgi:glycine betaine/choline ABC-type transport system substrate-binding protein